MKSTGIVRHLDNLGRLVIPKELRRTLNIDQKDAIEIYTDGDRIVLKKNVSGCCLCGIARPLKSLYPDKSICVSCINIIAGRLQQLMDQPDVE
ncbi:AbrB/MazE/SpoVT family DNA-binding domain-containing protein [Paenibacillus alvei]|uniref:AbrB/MazE/SpoVT family DNA-binding domain-containing protein n=1 Tax=Paenibacillus alvei TaxID=44250 RepID=UPI0018CD00A9|nr:AbrB/MazE/SpoVT family DNA-binding domain-containing protein [Paenibacillus alvei]MBG9737115.1 hypothetical protein [Paenibacillus alvei]MBG9742775.1 hypothetical protein [Paenibacillus alvei]MBG9746208.1 hypothetical protein [Paenibacillus alvei]